MKLPVVSGSEAVKAFGKVGYEFDEQHGSHIILRHAKPPHRRLSVPNHKEARKGNSASAHSRGWAYGRGVRAAALGGRWKRPMRDVWDSPMPVHVHRSSHLPLQGAFQLAFQIFGQAFIGARFLGMRNF